MNKKLVVLSILMILLALPVVGLAGGFELYVAPEPSRAGAINFVSIINVAVGLIWLIFVGVVVVLLIVTAFLFLTTYGNLEKAKKARLALLFVIIGIIVALLGYRMYATISGLIPSGATPPPGLGTPPTVCPNGAPMKMCPGDTVLSCNCPDEDLEDGDDGGDDGGATTGACCSPNKARNPWCLEYSAALCQDSSGIYKGNETTCTPDPC